MIKKREYDKALKIVNAYQQQLHKHNVSDGFSIPKYRKIPIVIMKWNDGINGWRAVIADNYENYKPATYDDINFEDLGFHFRHDIETHPHDNLVFQTRKDAVACAKFCNEKYLGSKAKIWFIS